MTPFVKDWPSMASALDFAGGGFVPALIQLLISGGFAALVVQLLLLRQNRRKIEGEASSSEASAASTLSDAAVGFASDVRQDSVEARKEAMVARSEAEAARGRSVELETELRKANWDLYDAQRRERVLVARILSLGGTVPEGVDEAQVKRETNGDSQYLPPLPSPPEENDPRKD